MAVTTVLAVTMPLIKINIIINNLARGYLIPIRYYSRGLRRRAVSVLDPLEDKVEGFEKCVRPAVICETSNISLKNKPVNKANKPVNKANFKPPANFISDKYKSFHKEHKESFKVKSKLNLTENPRLEDDNEIRSEADILDYQNVTDSTKVFSRLMTLVKNRKLRERRGEIVIEGKRLINDAINAGVQLKTIFFSRKENLIGLYLKDTSAPLYKVRYKDISVWSDVQKSVGIMAVFKIPKTEELDLKPCEIPVTVICDNVRDPGNMGCIIRSAAAAGCKSIICTTGCVDVWESKVLRAGAGAHFKLPILTNIGWEFVNNYLQENDNVYLADQLQSNSTFNPQLVDSDDSSDDTNWYEIENIDGKERKLNPSYLDPKSLEKYKHYTTKSIPLSQMKFNNHPSVLVVGGETEGLSGAAHKLLYDHNGSKIHIPMAFNIESLNVAIASSILLFEMKRQYIVICNENK